MLILLPVIVIAAATFCEYRRLHHETRLLQRQAKNTHLPATSVGRFRMAAIVQCDPLSGARVAIQQPVIIAISLKTLHGYSAFSAGISIYTDVPEGGENETNLTERRHPPTAGWLACLASQ